MPKRPPKSFKLVSQDRLSDQLKIEKIIERIRELEPRDEIRRDFSAQWKITQTQCENLIRQAYAQLREIREAELAYAKERQRDALGRMFRDSARIGDHTAALKALHQLAQVEGAYTPAQVEITSAVVLGQANPDAVRARIQELLGDPDLASTLRPAICPPAGFSEGGAVQVPPRKKKPATGS